MFNSIRRFFQRIGGVLYISLFYSTHVKYWPQIKWVRVKLNKKALPRPCCRRHEHRGPSYHVENADPNLTVNHCGTCNTRHFELVVDVGEMGLVLK